LDDELMRAFTAICAALVLWGAAAFAQMNSNILWDVPTSQHYQGPGDVVTFTAWFGVRGYSATIASTGTQKAMDLRRPSDSATCSPLIATNGSMDLTVGTPCAGPTTVTAWLNNASACTASITTTVMTVTACSAGNLALGLPIGGAAANTYITALGTGTGGTGTYTITPSQTLASGPVTAPMYAFISKLYDQVAGGACAGSCDVVQATAGSQPKLLLTTCGAGGLLPCIHGCLVSGCSLTSAANTTPATGVGSAAAVGGRFIGTGSGAQYIGNNGLLGPAAHVGTRGAAQMGLCGVTCVNGTASDAVLHSFNGVTNGASSVANVDGTETTGTVTNNTGAAQLQYASRNPANTSVYSNEGGFSDNVAWTSGQRTSICHNMRLYWGTAGSC
jgi:hypothetical protein